jgi:sugar/nucleoside kinase (ribokinase family)
MESSLIKRVLQRVQNIEEKQLPRFHIVMLPDFFLDHFVYFDSVENACHGIQQIAAQGGGNRPGIIQQIQQGGNAANTTLGLARLGMSSHLICRTNPFGLHLLEYFLGKNGVDLSGVHSDGDVAITTVLEFQNPQANVMIGDPGSVATFSFDTLHELDCELIASANLVGVTNWNLNRFGTELASEVFEFAKKENVKTFFDSGDPSPRIQEIPLLMEKVLQNPQMERFGLNENELRYYSKKNCQTQAEMITALESLKKNIPGRLDFHTADFSVSVQNTVTVVPTISVSKVYRSTGAGDIWNAANIFADLLGWETDERLSFANIVAGQYISSAETLPPTLDMIINFIKKII